MVLINDLPIVKPIDKNFWQEIQARFDLLIKPVGSLAKLEEITCLYASAHKMQKVILNKKTLLIFASDYSNDDSDLTYDSFLKITSGKSSLNKLADFLAVDIEIIDLGLIKDIPKEFEKYSKHFLSAKQNILHGKSISEEDFARAFNVGKVFSKSAIDKGAQVLALGHLGTGGDVYYTALLAKLFDLDFSSLENEDKVQILLEKKSLYGLSELELAKQIVSVEIPAMMGAILYAASVGVPIFLDGVATLLAAYLGTLLDKNVKDYLIATCTTNEVGQDILLTKLGLSTMLDLKLNFSCGEGSMFGFDLLEAGIRALNEMDSFGEVHFPLGDIK